MKRRNLIFIPLCFLLLSGCTSRNETSTDDKGKEEDKTKIAAPTLTVDDEGTILSWNAVEKATGYKVTEDQEAPLTVTNTLFPLSAEIGSHSISVVTLAPSDMKDSDPATFDYQVKYAAIKNLQSDEENITWDSYEGVSLQYKIGNDEYTTISGNSLAITADGQYTFRATTGFDRTNNIIYTEGTETIVSILISNTPTEYLVLEDGSAPTDTDLQQKYVATKYSDGWVSTTAALFLDTNNLGFTEGKCVGISYWKHGADFKFENTNLDFESKIYDTLSVTLKGTADQGEKFKFQLKVNNPDTEISGNNIQNVYATYTISPVPEVWTRYTISLDDPNWRVSFAGQTIGLEQLIPELNKRGINISSFSQLVPYFDTYSVMANCANDANWSSTRMWFDDLVFSTSHSETRDEPLLALYDNYAFSSDSLGGKLSHNNSGNWTLSFKNNQTLVELPVTVTKEEGKLHVVSTTENYDFDAFLTTENQGLSFVLETVTGSCASMLANLRAERFVSIDNFEYEDDAALRSAYYSDIYTGSAGNSIIGGPGWDVIDPTSKPDYLKVLENGHTGKGATIEYNKSNAMRYTSFGLSDGSASSFGKANKLSFWTKGLESRTSFVKIRIFSVKQLDKTNHVSTNVMVEAQFEIAAGSDWTECVVDLSGYSFNDYYGIAFLPVKDKGEASEGNKFVPIDDVTLYNDISPWGV